MHPYCPGRRELCEVGRLSLTGAALQIITVLLAVLAVVGSIFFWPKLALRSWLAVAERLGVIVVTQVLVLSAIALAINNQFGFYGSWSDLLGNEKQAVLITDHQNATSAVTPRGALKLPQGVPGQLEKVRIFGAKSGLTS